MLLWAARRKVVDTEELFCQSGKVSCTRTAYILIKRWQILTLIQLCTMFAIYGRHIYHFFSALKFVGWWEGRGETKYVKIQKNV